MMKHNYLKTHWTPDEAHAILMFLDELRDVIWQSYGSEIIAYHQALDHEHDETFYQDLDDLIPF